jgi:hypothetical protein
MLTAHYLYMQTSTPCCQAARISPAPNPGITRDTQPAIITAFAVPLVWLQPLQMTGLI